MDDGFASAQAGSRERRSKSAMIAAMTQRAAATKKSRSNTNTPAALTACS
jgi:hypothetical protein